MNYWLKRRKVKAKPVSFWLQVYYKGASNLNILHCGVTIHQTILAGVLHVQSPHPHFAAYVGNLPGQTRLPAKLADTIAIEVYDAGAFKEAWYLPDLTVIDHRFVVRSAGGPNMQSFAWMRLTSPFMKSVQSSYIKV